MPRNINVKKTQREKKTFHARKAKYAFVNESVECVPRDCGGCAGAHREPHGVHGELLAAELSGDCGGGAPLKADGDATGRRFDGFTQFLVCGLRGADEHAGTAIAYAGGP